MTLPKLSFEQFEADAKSRGFDEVIERRWAPGLVLQPHVHSFAVDARVVQGEMWLTVDADTRHLQAGQTFELERAVEHSERYGDQGAVVWVARRNAA
jgi:hypothetical protein